MSFDNNNSSTSALLLECFYRNKYEKTYWDLISKLPSEKPRTYKTEEHHIVSKCLGGHPTNKENLCYPTPREHFILHRLLNKMYPDHEGLFYASFRMSCKGGGRTYEYLRSNYVRSKEHNERISQSLKGQKLSEERKSKISKARLSFPNIPRGRQHPNSNKELESIKEQIKEIWLENGRPGDVKLGKLLGLDTAKNGYRCKTLQRFIRDFKDDDIV